MDKIFLIIVYILPCYLFAQNSIVNKGKKINYSLTKHSSGAIKSQFIIFCDNEAVSGTESELIHPNGVSHNITLYFHKNENIFQIGVLGNVPAFPKRIKTAVSLRCQDSSYLNPLDVKIEYQEEYKTILGFLCQKAIIVATHYSLFYKKEVEKTHIVYFTPKIKNALAQFKGLRGLPLEYQLQDEGIYTATEIKEFDIPQELTVQNLYPSYTFSNQNSEEAKKGLKMYQEILKKKGKN